MSLTRRDIWRTTALTAALAAAGPIGRPGIARAAPLSLWEQVKTSRKLRVGIIPSRPPYIYGSAGDWKGFSITNGKDLAAALSVAMDEPIENEWVITTWPTAILDLQSRRIDIFFGFAFSPERAKAIDLVGPLYAVPEVAVLGKDTQFGSDWSDYDKPSVTVSVAMGTTDEQAARQFLPHANVRAMKDWSGALLDVQSGNSAAIITSAIIGLGALRANPNLTTVRLLHPIYAGPSGGGVRKDGDGRLFEFCQGFAWAYRTSGMSKRVILDAMNELKMNTSLLPPEVTF